MYSELFPLLPSVQGFGNLVLSVSITRYSVPPSVIQFSVVDPLLVPHPSLLINHLPCVPENLLSGKTILG